MRIRTLTAAALILASLPVVTLAQGMPPRVAPTLDFAAADTDGDGAISRQEWQTYAGSLMQGLRAEGLGARADALIAAGDADGDGALTRDELVAALTAGADDRRSRMRGERREDIAEMRRHGHRDHEGHGGRRGEMRGDRGDRSAGGFARLDADGDGSLSPEELARAQEYMNWMAQRPRGN